MRNNKKHQMSRQSYITLRKYQNNSKTVNRPVPYAFYATKVGKPLQTLPNSQSNIKSLKANLSAERQSRVGSILSLSDIALGKPLTAAEGKRRSITVAKTNHQTLTQETESLAEEEASPDDHLQKVLEFTDMSPEPKLRQSVQSSCDDRSIFDSYQKAEDDTEA
jgi:hypothetical protein